MEMRFGFIRYNSLSFPRPQYNIQVLLVYSRRKYYCYHQNAKIFLVPFKNDLLSNIAVAILDSSLLLPI